MSIELKASPDLARSGLARKAAPAALPLAIPPVSPTGLEAAFPAVRVGIIGYGYWGPNLVRNLAESSGFEVSVVSDRRSQRLAQAARRHPTVHMTTDCNEIFANPEIDAVVIVTPVSTHFDLALTALRAGKHVLVTKPITATAQQAEKLIETAAEMDRILMVDHTFIYTGAVQRIKELIAEERLGRLYYYDSVRVNLGLFQHDVNVLWDLAVHDLAIMDYLLGKQPQAVAATGAGHVPGQPEDVAYLTCYFDDNLLTHHHVNWLAPVKVRRTLIGGDRQMIVYDDLEPSEKVKVYDKGITVDGSQEEAYQSQVSYRSGDMWAPRVSLTEALQVEAQHFLDSIRHKTAPVSDGEAGLRVVRILEAASESLARRGEPVPVADSGSEA